MDTFSIYLPQCDLNRNQRIDTTYNKLDIGAFEYPGIDVPDTPNIIFEHGNVPIEIYPNPANNMLYFADDLNDLPYSVFDLNGKKVQSGIITNNSISVNKLIRNTYILKIEHNNSYLKTVFIKN